MKRLIKITIVASIILLLSGCHEDNGPEERERKRAMQNCVGDLDIQRAASEIRIACTQAIYSRP